MKEGAVLCRRIGFPLPGLAAGAVLFLMAGIVCDLIVKGASGMEKYSVADLYATCRETRGGGGVLGGSISFFLQGYLETICSSCA